MDYLKSIVPSQLVSERGSNLVVINPGSANVRMGFASYDTPFNIPHCIAWYTNQVPKKNLKDQMLNSQITNEQHIEREKAYDIIASILKIPYLDEVGNNSFSRKIGCVDGYNTQSSKKDAAFTCTNVVEKKPLSFLALEGSELEAVSDSIDQTQSNCITDFNSNELKFKKSIIGEEAIKIFPTEPYCLHRPIRRGHFNVSQDYPVQQVIEDLHAIWDWILLEKLLIPHSERYMYSAVLVVPESFDNREIKEMLSIVLRDLCFTSAVVHQEGIAAVFGNGLSTSCVVNIGAQVTSVISVEDGVALPTTQITLPFGGEDIARCFLWTQRHHQTWPPLRTDPLTKPIDLLMLNRLKESYCQIIEGELDAVSIVHAYDADLPIGSHKTRLTALNVPPMGLFYPMLLVPDVHPPPPRSWFHDFEDMLEETWHVDFQRRSDIADGVYPSITNGGFSLYESYPSFLPNPKKQDIIGLGEAITTSIMSTGRIDLQRKLFCSIQLIGGVALTKNLLPAVQERVLHAIPPNESIDTVEVLQSRANASFVSWKGGVVLGILDLSRDAWIHRDDWIRNGIHLGCGRKYKDSYFLQAQATCYINS